MNVIEKQNLSTKRCGRIIIVEDYKGEAKDFFDSLTTEEFVELLKSVGIEVVDAVDGKGGVIFTDEIKGKGDN
jgi:hypothetical protein